MTLNDTGDHTRTALSIAGFDPCTGAGLASDLRTFEHFGVWGLGVITTLTFQNTKGITGRYDPECEVVTRQLEALLSDCRPDAVKTGALGKAIAGGSFISLLKDNYDGPVVVDPVLKASSGGDLIDGDSAGFLLESLVPISVIVTPNVQEVSDIWGLQVDSPGDAEKAAGAIVERGANAVLITGRRDEREGKPVAVDLFFDGRDLREYVSPWRDNLNIHGTGCVLSSAITAYLALGNVLGDSVEKGIEAVRAAIRNAVLIGGGLPCAIVRGFNN